MRSTRTRRARRSTSTSCWRAATPPRRSSTAASVSAVIAAAGSGERLGAGGPKAFVSLAGRPMAEWSIAAFRACERVRSIVVACPPGYLREPGGESELADEGVQVVEGGRTRSESVSNALAAVETELVAIHDAARPLVTPELIEGVVAALVADPSSDGAIAATPVTDTIKQIGAGKGPSSRRLLTFPHHGVVNSPNVVEGTLSRGRLWAAQTPQVFRTESVRRALEADPERVAAATDEAMLVEAVGGKVLIHPAPAENLKVTTPLDLRVAELLLADRAG